jgi:hypothetical protein
MTFQLRGGVEGLKVGCHGLDRPESMGCGCFGTIFLDISWEWVANECIKVTIIGNNEEDFSLYCMEA